MKRKSLLIGALPLLSVSVLGMTLAFSTKDSFKKVDAYAKTSISSITTIYLDDTDPSDVIDYYSGLNSLADNQKTGTNLLKNLKPILSEGQRYFDYDNDSLWKLYEITDRDWVKSPASSTTYGYYDEANNRITNYQYGSSASNSKNNPYIHALYINRNVENETTAWDDHNQDEWGINQEHVWPKSQGFEAKGAGGARGDPMHLMAGNGYSNNIHSNYFYGYVDTSKSYVDCGNKYSNQTGNLRGTSKTLRTGTVFEPQDSDKGDIARAIFYMVARYNYLSGSDANGIDQNNPNLELVQNANSVASYTSSTSKTGKMGVLSDLLEWNRLDPPDAYEIHRNNLLYTNYTNNRNPFIDFPDWAEYIWGTKAGSSYANPNADTMYGFNEGEPVVVNVTEVSLLSATSLTVGSTTTLTPSISPSNASDKAVTWTSSNPSVATISNKGLVTAVAEGEATITVTTHDGGYSATCLVTVSENNYVVDSFERSDTGVVSGTSYAVWTAPIEGTSGAVYNGASAPGNSSIQLTNKTDAGKGIYAGIVTTTSPGRVKRITINWNSNTGVDRAVTVYGKNTAYSGSSELYDNDAKGTSLGTITCGSEKTPTSLLIDGDYKYFGIYAPNPVYIDQVSVAWEVVPTSINLDQDEVELDLANESSVTLEATVLPDIASNKEITWTSSDEDVATVEDGVVSAVAVGEATITATTIDGGFTDNCAISVIDSSASADANIYEINKTTETVALDNNWTMSSGNDVTCYTTFDLDENINVSTTGAANCGSYWSLKDWRLYQNRNGNIILTAAEGCEIKTVSIIYNTQNNGKLIDSESNDILSSQVYDVNSDSVTYTVTSTGSNGQVRVKSIYVSYYSPVAPTPPTPPEPVDNTSPYINGVAYKLFLNNNTSDFFFTGSMAGYYGATSNTYASAVDVYFESSGGDGQYLYFDNGGDKTYISMTVSNNHVNFTLTTSTPESAWLYSGTYHCIYYYINNSNYTLGTYGQYSTFGTFIMSNTSNYYGQFKDTADSYSYKFLNSMTCDNSGETAPIFVEGYSWSVLSTQFSALDSSEQNTLTTVQANKNGNNIAHAAARYDLIVGKYGTSTYSDFMNRNPKAPSSGLYNYEMNNAVDSSVLIIMISMVSVGSFGLYLSLRKKK